jgi:hypothetical protein
VNLTLDITDGASPTYQQTIQAACSLKASLDKAGARAKVRLRCDLGEQYAAFPGLTPVHVAQIDAAFAGQQRARGNSKNGRLKVSHVGAPSPGGVPISCGLPPPVGRLLRADA